MRHIKNIKKFNETVVIPNKKVIIDFLDEIEYGKNRPTFASIKGIANKHGIEITEYDDFYKNLPDEYKHKAPKKGECPMFGFVDPKTNMLTIVYQVKSVDRQLCMAMEDILMHELVHLGQKDRRDKTTKFFKTDVDNDPKKPKEYFSDSDEQMAFAQTVSKDLIDKIRCTSAKDGISKLGMVPLWNNVIKKHVDMKILNKYKKYIYQYLQQHFSEK